jgi:flavin reductase (DIM6/NTAB) family NADH-FMN oxidoreductase RutF
MQFVPSALNWRDAHELLVGIVVPRPIALISTIGENGVNNVAPFSFYGLLSIKPAILYVGVGAKVRAKQEKDTYKNIKFTNDFVVDEALAEPMNQTSANYPDDVDEFKEAGLTAVASDLVKSPRVAESPISMECKVWQIMNFGEFPENNNVVLGEIVKVHVRDDLWVNDAIQMSKLKAIARLGEELFCRTGDVFELKRPYILGQ